MSLFATSHLQQRFPSRAAGGPHVAVTQIHWPRFTRSARRGPRLLSQRPSRADVGAFGPRLQSAAILALLRRVFCSRTSSRPTAWESGPRLYIKLKREPRVSVVLRCRRVAACFCLNELHDVYLPFIDFWERAILFFYKVRTHNTILCNFFKRWKCPAV